MKLFYWLFALAVLLDLVIVPWLFGVGWLMKFVLTLLPFAFLFLNNRSVTIIFLVSSVYLRLTSSLNLGILFLALVLFFVFERWFLVNFFHREAWQTAVLSSLGIAVFYIIVFGVSFFITPTLFYLSFSVVISLLLSAGFSIPVTFLLRRAYPHVLR